MANVYRKVRRRWVDSSAATLELRAGINTELAEHTEITEGKEELGRLGKIF
jgi:hypothetical protein